MGAIFVTGSGGLVGSETCRFYLKKGYDVVGIDNNMRQYFFGPEASTAWNVDDLKKSYPKSYVHYSTDIRNPDDIDQIFRQYAGNISLIVHAAAQPSHDWAAKEPFTDFAVNANGTLNLLESYHKHCSSAVFIYVSTNKVYGDTPNKLPLVEQPTRWEIAPDHKFARSGIDESMSIDNSTHSLFGVSKAAADLLVQEYGRYFGLKTACFRGGCLTGPGHSGAQLHGFLAYLVKCCATGSPYTIFGYNGKQVRDNIHSADLILAFDAFFKSPRIAEVYNMGGGTESNCSMTEAIAIAEKVTGRKLNVKYDPKNRIGDHIWYVSNLQKFKSHYPNWNITYKIEGIVTDIFQANWDRWLKVRVA
jgi:CDP-paratose 2-epimerase